MKKIFISLFITMSFFSSLFAIEESEIQFVMEKKIEKVLKVLKNKQEVKEQKAKAIFGIMDEMFDFNVMSRISLGKAWKGLTPDQKVEFTKLFVSKLKQSYIEKMELYTNQEVKILKTQHFKKNRIKLLTNIIGADEVYKIDYKFYKNRSGQWFIYDVDIIGVSILQTYRKQFAGFLKQKSFQELLDSL